MPDIGTNTFVGNIIDIRGAPVFYALCRKPDGRHYYLTDDTTTPDVGDAMIWENPGLQGEAMVRAVDAAMHPPGRLYVTKRVSSPGYFFQYDSPYVSLEITASRIYTGSSNSEELQLVIDGVSEACYTDELISIGIVMRSGHKFVEFEVYYSEQADMYTTYLPLENCIEGLYQLKAMVKEIEDGTGGNESSDSE
jgi:hypothetical protein